MVLDHAPAELLYGRTAAVGGMAEVELGKLAEQKGQSAARLRGSLG
jgi:hypothetical protein